jgi:hypothetical protein
MGLRHMVSRANDPYWLDRIPFNGSSDLLGSCGIRIWDHSHDHLLQKTGTSAVGQDVTRGESVGLSMGGWAKVRPRIMMQSGTCL